MEGHTLPQQRRIQFIADVTFNALGNDFKAEISAKLEQPTRKPGLSQLLLQTAAASGKPADADQATAGASPTETLSDKEEKILSLIADGKSNKQIAAAVFLAEGTVKNYVSRIMEKLHANTRTELAVISVRQRRGD